MNQNRILVVGKLMANHSWYKAQNSCCRSHTSLSGRSNSIATSIGFLPLLNRCNACVVFDLLLKSALLSLPSILLMIFAMSPNYKRAAWAIPRIVFPS
jgi:hypothetical protein